MVGVGAEPWNDPSAPSREVGPMHESRGHRRAEQKRRNGPASGGQGLKAGVERTCPSLRIATRGIMPGVTSSYFSPWRPRTRPCPSNRRNYPARGRGGVRRRDRVRLASGEASVTAHRFVGPGPKGSPLAPPKCSTCRYTGKTISSCEDYETVWRATAGARDSLSYDCSRGRR